MKKVYLLLSMALLLLAKTTVAQITISGSTGTANGIYTSFTNAGGAFAALNTGGSHNAGDVITISITSDVSGETGANALSAGVWTSIVINPSGTRTVSGTVNGPLIDLNGADNVTINGLNAGGSTLAISNTSTGTSASTIRFINDATNNTVSNCNILGSSTNTTGGTIFFSTGAVTGNDNNTITQCNISSSVSGSPVNAIYSSGTSAAIDNSSNTLSILNVADYFSATASSTGININNNNSGWTISNNALYQTATRIYSAANTHYGIQVLSGSNYTITNNLIGGDNPTGTGTTKMAGITSGTFPGSGTFPTSYTTGGTANATRFVAINCAFTAGGAVSSLQNNTVQNIALYTSSGAATTYGVICGIQVTSGNANIGTVTGNTIGAASGASSLYAACTTAGGVISGIYCTTTNAISIQNNTIGGIDVSGTSGSTAAGFKGIDAAGTGSYTISSNNIGNATASNIRTGYLLTGGNLSNAATTPTTASGTSAVQGILNSSTGATLNITGNTFRGILISGSATSFTGINNTGAVTTALNITGNNFGIGLSNFLTLAVANSGTIACVSSSATSAALALNISSNNFQNTTYSAACTGAFQCIVSSNNVLSETFNSNTINLAVNTTNATLGFLISATNATPTVTIIGNTVNGFTNSNGTGAANYFAITNNGGTPTSGSSTITNNTLSNITFKTTTSYGAAILWLSGSGATCTHNITVSNNILSNINNTGAGTSTQAATLYGIATGAGNLNVIANNDISFLTAAGGSVIGILPATVSTNTTTGGTDVRNNIVHDIKTTSVYGTGGGTAAGSATGIQVQSGPVNNFISKNKVYNISSVTSGANTGGTATGITIVQANATSTNYITNNIVGQVYAVNSTYYQSVRGINIGNTVANTTNVYYNSVYLDGSVGIQSYCLYMASATANTNLRNNIFVNNAVSGSGADPQMAIFRTGTLTATYATTSNNNILYCGTPSSINLIYADGAVNALTNSQTTLAGFQAYVGPTRESASKTENTPFQNTVNGALATYLHINSNTTLAESGAVNIIGYTDDYDAQTRQGNGGYIGTGTAPDIGADEFEFVPTYDVGAVSLVTPAVSGCRTTTETVTVSIKNYGGANIDFSVTPVTVTVTATGPNTYSSTTILNSGTLASLASMNVVMPATFDMTAGGTYTFNASATISGDIDNTNDAMAAASRISAVFGGTYTVGAAGNYPTLTAAVAAYNAATCFSSNVTFSLIDATYSASETFPITINSNAAAGSNTLTIVPASGNTATITGNNTTAILKLNGADNVIIDGSNNGTNSQNLSIINTNTTSLGLQNVIWISAVSSTDAATSNTIKNCIITGNANNTTFSCIASTGSAVLTYPAAPNSNNTIQNNNMGKCQEGMFIIGYNSGSDDNWNITQNIIGSSTNTIGFDGLVLSNMKNYTVSSNTVSNVTLAANPSCVGINIQDTHLNGNIYGNNINTIFNTSTSFGAYGIELQQTNTAANINIYNNFIYGVRAGGNATVANNGFGIYAIAGGGYKINYNTISMATNQSNGNGTTAPIQITSGITTAASIELKNNILSNTQTNSTRYAIYSTAANTVLSTMDYNDYYNAGTNLAYRSGNLANLAAIQAVGGFGNNTASINVLPNFISATDLHLVSNSNCALDGTGNNAGILLATDYDGNARSTTLPFTTDIGADEFTGDFLLTITNPPTGCTVDLTAAAVTAGSTSGTTLTYWEDAGATTAIQAIHGTAAAITTSGTYYIKSVKGSCSSIQAVTATVGSTPAVNVALATSSTNGMDLPKTCDDPTGWTYYTDPGNANRYLFAIQWDPTSLGENVAAKAAATVRIQVDPSYFTVNDNSVPYGTWTMQRYWNVDLHSTAMTAPVNVRFFYDATETAAVDAQASSFASTYTGTLEPPTWFKTKTGSFTPDVAHVTEDGVLNAIGLVDVNAGPAAKINNVLYAQFNTVSSFSGGTYATGVGPNTPLPIVLNYLRGVKQGNKNNLSWQVTCTSTPKATLTLERSSDAANFTAIYTIVADAVRCYQPFDYQDATPGAGKNYYRLKMTDENGKFTYSNIIAILNEVKGFEVLNIAPNPVTTGRFKLNVTSAENTKMNVVIVDMQGRVVQQQTVSMVAGYNSLDMNVINLAAGTYNIYGTTASDKSKVIRFVKQ